ncbi:type I methionyl aminopeptidase [Candidatus Saccharibacteria bacterium]|nr:type I methionyl aminopeptidase [Candidatus Saccharibacteria bacterium]
MDEKKITAMRAGGKIMARIFAELKDYTKAGLTGREVSDWVEKKILEAGAQVAYYEPEVDFPGSICISVNDELIHGTPKDIPFEEGDKVSYDLVIKYQGYYVDSAFTMIIGKPTAAQKHLLSFTESSLYEGIEQVKAGAKLGDIGAAVEKTLEKGKLGVIRNYVGHGIGKSMHMPPEVPNYGKKGQGYELKAGDTICIEPMSSLGKPDTVVVEDDDDGWTVCLKDGSLGCHFEHTILVTEDGYEILTQA